MAGIAGILKRHEEGLVKNMLEQISNRGNYAQKIFHLSDATIGMVWSFHEDQQLRRLAAENIFRDGPGYGQSAEVKKVNGNWQLSREGLGAVPLYKALDQEGNLMFASEAKALISFSNRITEIGAGQSFSTDGALFNKIILKGPAFQSSPEEIATGLLQLLQKVIQRRINSKTVGAWLSGGLDSSSIAALVKPYAGELHTFSGGLPGSPDLDFAREMAEYIGSKHHEVILNKKAILKILPDVIRQLESFDALLVRSTIVNMAISCEASEFVSEVFSGEGGDELFAGYAYLKEIPETGLEAELMKLLGKMHNGAFQRVDRSASSFGMTPHMIFADPEIIEYALRIPVNLKIQNGTEKWILRRAMKLLLPEDILQRPKSKFWEGAGINRIIYEHADSVITDSEFRQESLLKNGWTLNSKEELLYYRIFKETFGDLDYLDWIGRTDQNN